MTRSCWVAWVILALVLSVCACQNKVSGSVEEEIMRTVHTGLVASLDPFARSEALRVLEILAQEGVELPLSKEASPGSVSTDKAFLALLDSREPMVRIAAIRLALALGREEARPASLLVFTEGSDIERRTILEAVLRYGPNSLKQELVARGINSVRDNRLRRMAFEEGYLRSVDAAIEAGEETALNQRLLPEMGTFVTRGDGLLAAESLQKFMELGHRDRAVPLLEKIGNPRSTSEEFVQSARILVAARVEEAKPIFAKILRKTNEEVAEIGIPERELDPAMERWATLGLVALGDDSVLPSAQSYLDGVSTNEVLEVLEALGGSSHPSATISIKVAMQDSRIEVRTRAVELYSERGDVSPEAMMRVMITSKFETKRKIAALLRQKFAEPWSEALQNAFETDAQINPTMRLLQEIITNREEASILEDIRPHLERQRTSPMKKRSQLATYLLLVIDQKHSLETFLQLDRHMQYALLEFCVRSDAAKYTETFQAFLTADNFSLRMMAAAGMWKASTDKS